jgi:DNA-binding response OmpR family regulator
VPGVRILVVEDEPQLAGHVCRALSRRGHAVVSANDGHAGLTAALSHPVDLIVLDLNLPILDGLSVLTALRKENCPSRVLILTARGEVGSRVKGLEAGADDYLPKPFAMEELIARAEALGRRSTTPPDEEVLRVGDLSLDLRGRRVARSGHAIPLSPREFEVLEVLMREPGRPFSRTELCERVWQRDHQYDTRTVEIFIARLRRKVDSNFPHTLIHTVRGVGYSVGVEAPAG